MNKNLDKFITQYKEKYGIWWTLDAVDKEQMLEEAVNELAAKDKHIRKLMKVVRAAKVSLSWKHHHGRDLLIKAMEQLEAK
jgi:hypothetical protein